ncbi:hypothetical protein H0A36_18895 [Endozoicomonas sp. SM1973]|uniref:Uncharacterized protein n=1 Tax=Spartinivicinus marinus TaxID=2994442 RepID=A0A853IF28_9GAMM|nr:hypothetical protein [Spartinivicinus marinus]MCX4029756.1 hypothetical protein [Spartinivicinus marinus]NYZ68087.1 hypothetical protein [Spartinivicinus marinus]
MDDDLLWDFSGDLDLFIESEKEVNRLLTDFDELIDCSGLDELMDFEGEEYYEEDMP